MRFTTRQFLLWTAAIALGVYLMTLAVDWYGRQSYGQMPEATESR